MGPKPNKQIGGSWEEAGPSRDGWEGEFIGDDGRVDPIGTETDGTGQGRRGSQWLSRCLHCSSALCLSAPRFSGLALSSAPGPDMTGFLASASKKKSPPLAGCDRFADGLLSPGESYPDRDEPRSHIYLSAAACRQSAVTTNSLLAVVFKLPIRTIIVMIYKDKIL